MIRPRTFASVAMCMVMLATVVMSALGGGTVNAQQSGSGNALRISPVRTDLVVKPGTSQTVELFLQNLTGSSAKLHPLINDFTVQPDNESGQPDIILDESKSATTHGLKQFVTPLKDFTILPNEQKSVKVTVTVPAGTAGGGYYGAIRFEPLSSTGDRTLSLSASVGSLILVKVPGDIQEQLSIASFDVRKGQASKVASSFYTDKKDLRSVVRFRNQGNVQVEPFGKVTLKNQTGKVLATYEVNNTQPRGNVLPDSVRRFETPLDKVGSFGKYTVEGNYGYGTSGQLLTASKTFYVVPLPLILGILGVIVLILGAVFVLPRMIRSYNKRILRKAGRR